jgi:dipeptidyl aminopeptidase/acylaminoacyl peptidase
MLFFEDFTPFAFQIQRLLAECPSGGGEVTEVSRATARMRVGDFDSWQEGWMWLAEHVRERADAAAAGGKRTTAREAYFRAANYYRSAEFFLGHDHPDKLPTWESMTACFGNAAALWNPPFEPLDLPYEDGVTLPGYLVRPVGVEGPLPVVVYLNGADGTKEESWYLAGRSFVERGVSFVALDGPGQGEPLRIRQIHSRPDYEAVVAPAVEALKAREDVDPQRIALVGISMGGYYAGRAGAYVDGLAALALHGACHNIKDDLYDHYPGIRKQLQWVAGVFDEAEASDYYAAFDLADHLHRVKVPTYICHGSEDHLVRPSAATATYDGLTGAPERVLRMWTPEETGQEHANIDNPTEAYAELSDWVVERLT